MAITEHDRKVGALLGLDPAKIAENRRQAAEKAHAQAIKPLTRERMRELSAFSAEISDEEFERYLASIYEQRGRAS
jgi:hypothetical protein